MGGASPASLDLLHLSPSPSSGLKRIHALTTQAAYELHVDLEDFDNGTAYAHYGSFGVGLFSVDPEEDGYPLTVAEYSGTAGEAHSAIRERWPTGSSPFALWGWGLDRKSHRVFTQQPYGAWVVSTLTHFIEQRAESGAGARGFLGLDSVGPLSWR